MDPETLRISLERRRSELDGERRTTERALEYLRGLARLDESGASVTVQGNEIRIATSGPPPSSFVDPDLAERIRFAVREVLLAEAVRLKEA